MSNRVEREVIAELKTLVGVTWWIATGRKHKQIFIDGTCVGVISLSDRPGRDAKKVIAAIRNHRKRKT